MNAKRPKLSSLVSSSSGCGKWPPNSPVKAQDVPESILGVEGQPGDGAPRREPKDRVLERLLYGSESLTNE